MSSSLTSNSSHIDAAFSFEDYKFIEAYINMSDINDDDNLRIDFIPAGEYNQQTGQYNMSLCFSVSVERKEVIVKIINVKCLATFKFRQVLPFENLPAFFFQNSTAIIYPYIRAFVSTLTVQANYNAIVLPTLNISALGKELQEKTVVKD